jgi:hypothetical protein
MLAITTSSSFTRPADTTAYASGDLVANSTTAGSVTPMTFTMPVLGNRRNKIVRARIKKSGNSVTSASFRLHLYTSSPTVTNGDNGAWLSSESGYIGSIDVVVDKAFNDSSGPAVGYGSPTAGAEVNLPNTLGGTGKNTLYGLLEARATYTPASAEVFTAAIETEIPEVC